MILLVVMLGYWFNCCGFLVEFGRQVREWLCLKLTLSKQLRRLKDGRHVFKVDLDRDTDRDSNSLTGTMIYLEPGQDSEEPDPDSPLARGSYKDSDELEKT